MSAAEIADNKWELSSTKPPVGTAPGIAQIVLMGAFALFFGWIIANSLIAIVTPAKEGGLADQYKNMNKQGAAAAEEPAAQ